MKTDPLVGKQKTGAWPLWLGLAMGIVALVGAGVGIYHWLSSMKEPQQDTAAKPKLSYLPRLKYELTGQYYCYNQLASLKPLYWQLLLNQKSIYLNGEYAVLGSGSGTVSGTLDDRFNIQLTLSSGDSSKGPLSSLPIPGIGGGSQSQIFVLMGRYSINHGEMLLAGTSENTTASNENDARPRRFYCSSYRPTFWGRS